MTINYWRATTGQFFFTIRSSNGNTLATSETYRNKADAMTAGRLIKAQAAGAREVDNT